VSTKTLPRLLDRRTLAEELGVTLASAENLMRKLPKVSLGRRVFVCEPDVRDYLKREARS